MPHPPIPLIRSRRLRCHSSPRLRPRRTARYHYHAPRPPPPLRRRSSPRRLSSRNVSSSVSLLPALPLHPLAFEVAPIERRTSPPRDLQLARCPGRSPMCCQLGN